MTQLQVLDGEIATKGICYVVCLTYDALDFADTVSAACVKASECGARQLRFTVRDENQMRSDDVCIIGGYRFLYDTEFILMQKTLKNAEARIRPLRLKPLRAGNDALFCALYNEAFYDLPNSITMNDAEMQRLLRDERRSAGFFMDGGEPVGTFVLQYGDTAPEIAAIGIRSDLQNQGYGTRALHTLEVRLLHEGFDEVQLLTAKNNAAACALYRAAGYRLLRTSSRWFRVELWNE